MKLTYSVYIITDDQGNTYGVYVDKKDAEDRIIELNSIDFNGELYLIQDKLHYDSNEIRIN